jgi:hypothetical protein
VLIDRCAHLGDVNGKGKLEVGSLRVGLDASGIASRVGRLQSLEPAAARRLHVVAS